MKYINVLLLLFSVISADLCAKTLMIKIQVISGQHQVVDAWLVEQDYPASSAPVSKRDSVSYQLLDSRAKTLVEGQAYAPTGVSGAYILASEAEREQFVKQDSKLKDTSYYIRVANYQPNMRELRLKPNSLVKMEGKTTQNKGSATENKSFILANWLR